MPLVVVVSRIDPQKAEKNGQLFCGRVFRLSLFFLSSCFPFSSVTPGALTRIALSFPPWNERTHTPDRPTSLRAHITPTPPHRRDALARRSSNVNLSLSLCVSFRATDFSTPPPSRSRSAAGSSSKRRLKRCVCLSRRMDAGKISSCSVRKTTRLSFCGRNSRSIAHGRSVSSFFAGTDQLASLCVAYFVFGLRQ